MKNIKGTIILLIAAFFWGSTFVAQVLGNNTVGVFTYNASRCFVGCVFLLGFISIREIFNSRKQKNVSKSRQDNIDDKVIANEYNAAYENTGKTNKNHAWPLLPGFLVGMVLFLAMSSQQAGISLYPEGVAAAGRSGFLTAIYVVIVAVIAAITKRHIHILVLFSVIITVVGMYLLCITGSIREIYLGDILCIICAFCFSAHILVIDHYDFVDSVKLSCLQFLFAGVFSLVVALIMEHITLQGIIDSALPILYAGILSSGVAFTLQIVGQKYAEPSVASIAMSMESVFAVISGAVVLGETLTSREYLGCALVFAAVIIAQLPQFFSKANNKK